jgi:glutamate-ammonia-ligase adenylyltransferase
VVHGEHAFADQVVDALAEGAFGVPWQPGFVEEILAMRERLQDSRPPRDLKRGPGGLADVEFLVQTFQLAHGRDVPALRVANTWQALVALREAGLLAAEEQSTLQAGYDFLLRVQSRLRIVHNRTLDAVPEAAGEVEKLARRLGFEAPARFLTEVDYHRGRLRELYRRLMERERARAGRAG